MPLRKLGRVGGSDAGGSQGRVSGGRQQPGAGSGQAGADHGQMDRDALIDQMISVLMDARQETAKESDPSGEGESALEALKAQNPPSRLRLEKAAGEVLAALHAAKQELANEMETNLKQLKAVLQETQKIAKNMEAVLQEAKAEPKPEELAKGMSGNKQQSKQGDQSQWNPPGLKEDQQQKAGGQQDDQDQNQDQNQGSGQEPPPWEPPKEATQPQAQQN